MCKYFIFFVYNQRQFDIELIILLSEILVDLDAMRFYCFIIILICWSTNNKSWHYTWMEKTVKEDGYT